MKNFEIRSGVVYLAGESVDLPFPAVEAVEVEGGVVVRVEVPVGHIFNRNVFLIDEHHSIRWQIQEPSRGGAEDQPFMNLIEKEGSLVAGNWNGVDYDVDLASGEIQVCAFRR